MKKSFVVAAVVATAALCSCGSAREEYNKPVDFSQLVAEYERAEKDSDLRDSLSMAQGDLFKCNETDSPSINQNLCCPTKWWTEISPEPHDNNLLRNAALLYNVSAFYNSIIADYEIWARGQETGSPLVSDDKVITAISKVDVDVIKNAKYRKCAKECRDSLVSCMKDLGKTSEDYNPITILHQYDSAVVMSLTRMLIDSVVCVRYDNQVDSIINSYDSVQQQIANAPGGRCTHELLHRVQQSKTFEEQCGIVLAFCCKQEYGDAMFTTKLMQTLLESGRYSVLLGRMWAIWRAFSQETWGGISRDSCIPNDIYDMMRKKAYVTIIGYLEECPDDRCAVANAALMAIDVPLVRNGGFPYGNDAPLEILTYCPMHYGDIHGN